MTCLYKQIYRNEQLFSILMVLLGYIAGYTVLNLCMSK